jgi:para-nitrobenzyl esterase
MVGIDADERATSGRGRPDTRDVAWRTFTWAQLHAKNGAGRTYGYVFSRVPPWMQAASHGAELPYVFGYPPRLAFFARAQPWKGFRDSAIAEEMQAYWTNFAKTGDPNGHHLPTWTPFAPCESILNFSDTTRMEALPYHAGLSGTTGP